MTATGQDSTRKQPTGSARKPWVAPKLACYDIAEITRGGTSSGPDAPCNLGNEIGNC